MTAPESSEGGVLSIRNDQTGSIQVWLEPWGDLRELAPGEVARIAYTGPKGVMDLVLEPGKLFVFGWVGLASEFVGPADTEPDERVPRVPMLPAAMSTHDKSQGGAPVKWYEVWADDMRKTPYVLLLRPHAGGFEIIDPAEGYRQVTSFADYEDAKNWLLEDEFESVARKYLDD